jgi:eukaryotic-like serine/threonine-protein kinase
MTPEEKWRHVEEFFHGALQLSVEERRRYLEHVLGNQPDILIEVESLLAHHSAKDDLVPNLRIEEARSAVLRDGPRFFPGQVIDDYEIVSLLGSGGSGEVYLATDRRLTRSVAIKVLTRLHSSDPRLLHGLKAEAEAASRLNHPNILTVHTFGQKGDMPYIVSEFVEGTNLRELIGKLSVTQALSYAFQIGSALRAAHRTGIIHRDIKPENLIVRNDGYVKVIDFGLARAVAPAKILDHLATTAAHVRTATGFVAGTASYMSPEQLRGEKLDARTDLWSWGVVLYEMVSGRRPFQGNNLGEVMSGILNREPADPCNSNKLNHIVARALEKRVDRRYQDMDEALNDLSALREIGSAGLNRIAPSEFGTDVRGRSHSVRLTWLTISLFLLLAGVATWRWYPAKSYHVASISQITNRGDVTSVALSRNGDHIAYAAEFGGEGSLHVIELGTNIDAERVPHYFGQNNGITFSPDDRFIYYVLNKDGNGTLYRVPFVGGEPREILNDIDSPITFSPDGHEFAFERFDPTNKVGMILISDFQNTSVTAKVAFPLYLSRTLDWAPNGKSILFGVYDDSISGPQRIKFGALFPRESRIEYGKPSGWGWTGTHVALSSDSLLLPAKLANTDSDHLYQLRWRTGEFEQVTYGGVAYDGLSGSVNRGALATIQLTLGSSLWLLNKGKSTRLTPAPSGRYTGVAWMSNRELLVGAEINSNKNLWRVDKETQRAEPLTEGRGSDSDPAASSGGDVIVFSSSRDGGSYHIWRAFKDGRSPQRLTSGNNIEIDPALSPDARWVVFSSDRDGIMKLWRVPVDGGDPVKVSDHPARHPDISPDGRWIVCEYSDRPGTTWSVGILDAKNGSIKSTFSDLPKAAPDTTDQQRQIRWSPSGESLIYVFTQDGVSNLWEKPLHGGRARPLTLFSEGKILDFAPSFDGNSIAYVKDTGGGDVALIQGSYR